MLATVKYYRKVGCRNIDSQIDAIEGLARQVGAAVLLMADVGRGAGEVFLLRLLRRDSGRKRFCLWARSKRPPKTKSMQ